MSRHAAGEPSRYNEQTARRPSRFMGPDGPAPQTVQIHFQKLSDPMRTKFVEQHVCHGDEDLAAWLNDVRERVKLPEGMQWLVCNQDYEGFVKGK